MILNSSILNIGSDSEYKIGFESHSGSTIKKLSLPNSTKFIFVSIPNSQNDNNGLSNYGIFGFNNNHNINKYYNINAFVFNGNGGFTITVIAVLHNYVLTFENNYGYNWSVLYIYT